MQVRVEGNGRCNAARLRQLLDHMLTYADIC
jgi:hypothetical protein